MGSILVFAEHLGSDFKRGTYELLTAAQTSGLEVNALVLGPGSELLAKKLGAWGVKEALVCEDNNLKEYNPELFLSIVAEAISSLKPEYVLAPASMLCRDLFPRVAQKVTSAVASDCTELSFTGGAADVRKPLYAGRCSAKIEFQNSTSGMTKIILMRANQLPVGSPMGQAEVSIKKLSLKPVDLKTKIKEIVKGATEKLDLTEANIIVSGGRGMKGPEHFKLLEDLASVLGATVGASRAVVDAGWVPHSMQVGQTGKTVAPTLYIACGISGAIQHLAGMSGSKVIVAINKDPDAPIFQKSTYGIVGDVFEVVPALTEEFKKLLQ